MQGQTIDMYLIAGQSNADGRAEAADLPAALAATSSDVQVYLNEAWHDLQPGLNNDGNAEWFGPELALGRCLQQAYPERKIVLVKHAAGSTDLGNCWRAPDSEGNNAGAYYAAFIKTVNDAIASVSPSATARIRGMIWMQGETDAWYDDPSMAMAYEENLTAFVRSVRSDLDAANMPFCMGRISQTWTWSGGGHGEIVRQAQYDVSQNVPCTVMIDTDDLTLNPDMAHYDAAGQVILGERFAGSIIGLEQTVP